jgi:hypothetical protein
MTDLSQTPFVPIRVATGLGTLALRPRRFGDLGAVADMAPDDTSAARLRRLFARVATVEGENVAGSPGAAETLGNEDLEVVAAAYLAMPDVRLLSEGGAGREPTAREPGETSIAYLDRLLRADQDRQLADLAATFAGLQPPRGGDLESALAALDAEAAALRDAVAALAAAGGAPAAPGIAADVDGAAPPSRADAALLTRSLARVTARSALLQASVSDASAAVLRRADSAAQATRASGRRTLAVGALAAILAAAAAALAALGVVEERDNARAFQRWQAAASATLQEERLARVSAQQAQDARLREIADRQAATTAALRAAAAPPPTPEAPATNTARQDAAKGSTKPRTPQRKANR